MARIKDLKHKVLIILLIIVMMLCLGCAVGIQGNTIIDWWIPTAIAYGAAAMTAVAGWRLWTWLSGSQNIPLNIGIHTFIGGTILLAAFYAINFWVKTDNPITPQNAEIVRAYSEEHHRTRRVGRRYVSQGEKYFTYHIDIKFPDGRQKKLSVAAGNLRSYHRGDSIEIDVQRGALGVPVIRNRHSRP